MKRPDEGAAARGAHGVPRGVRRNGIERDRSGDLRSGAQRFQLALAAGRLGDWDWDAATDLVTFSEQAAEIFGLPYGEPITTARIRELLHEEYREPARLAVEHALESRTDYDFEYRVRRPSGQDCWIAARGRGVYAEDGRVLGMVGVVQDVSARREAEQALRSNEELLRATFEQAAVGIAVAGVDGRFIQTNRKFEEILGYDQAEIRTLSFRDITHPDDAQVTERAVESLLSGKAEDHCVEKRYRRKDGSVIWSLTTVSLIRDPAGCPLRFVAVIEDITKRRHTEDALRVSEEFNRTIIESSRDCIKTLSLDGRVLWISENGRKLLQPLKGDLLGVSWLELWGSEDREQARAAVEAAARGDTGKFVGSLVIGGRTTWWDVVLTPIRGVSGRPSTLLAVSRDVTERVEMERRLRDEARVLELLNETSTALTSELDIGVLLQSVTDAATELSGAKFGAFFYNTTDERGGVYRLFTLSGASRADFERIGHPRATPLFGPTFRGEGVIRCDDVQQDPRYGRCSPHHGTPPGHLPVRSYLAVPVISRSGAVIGGLFFGHPEPGVFGARTEALICSVAAQAAIAIDNARLYEAAHNAAEERRRLLESERLARAEAERASAIKDEFLAVLSHELRTPLNAILGWASVLRMRAAGNEEWAKSLEIIERNARMQSNLIDDLLDMSRIVSGKMRLDLQPVSPATFVEAAVETVRPVAAAKGIELTVDLDRSVEPIFGDPARLQQVVWNLLSNAIKFTPNGGRVEVRLERFPGHVEITVADSGVGIEPTLLAYVFDRFRQGDSSTTRQHGGLGLGLAIVKHLVELHGGNVSAHSDGVGRGARFCVVLPIAGAQRKAARSDGRHASGSAPLGLADLSGVKILVVDDEPDAGELLTAVLEDCGAQVVATDSAEQAVLFVERERPDVLLSDIGMPGADGYELLRRVRALGDERGGRVPAVALTAFARHEDRARALGAGFLEHLSKPVDASELVTTIARVVGRWVE